MGPDDLVRLIVFVVMIGLVGFFIAGLWKVLEKAGEPGWKVLLPIYNSVVVLRIAGMSAWWILPMLVPYVSIAVGIFMCIKLARAFGKGGGFATGLILLPFVFIPILGFGSATYLGADRSGELEENRSGEDEDEEEPETRRRNASRRRDPDEDWEEEEPVRPRQPSTLTARSSAPPKSAATKPTVVRCISCDQRLRLPATVIGKKVKCPQCENVFVA